MTDEMLLAGFGTGDPAMSVAFVRRFQAVIFGAALSVLGERADAEDVAQHSFEQAWRHAVTYDPRRGSVRVWLAAIARREAASTARRRTPTPTDPLILADLLGHDHAPSADDPGIPAAARLRSALAVLPEGQARAVVLAAIYGQTAAEIADHEHIPLGTAKTRLRAAMGKLREHLLTRSADDHGAVAEPENEQP